MAAKAFRNGAENPNAWRRTPMSDDEVAGSAMVSDPLTQYMFCSPGEGAVALVLCRAEVAHRYTDRPVHLDAVSFTTRHYGSFEVFSPWLSPERADGPSVVAARAAFEQAASGPRTSTSPRSRTPSRAPRSCTWPRPGSARTASRRA